MWIIYIEIHYYLSMYQINLIEPKQNWYLCILKGIEWLSRHTYIYRFFGVSKMPYSIPFTKFGLFQYERRPWAGWKIQAAESIRSQNKSNNDVFSQECIENVNENHMQALCKSRRGKKPRIPTVYEKCTSSANTINKRMNCSNWDVANWRVDEQLRDLADHHHNPHDLADKKKGRCWWAQFSRVRCSVWDSQPWPMTTQQETRGTLKTKNRKRAKAAVKVCEKARKLPMWRRTHLDGEGSCRRGNFTNDWHKPRKSEWLTAMTECNHQSKKFVVQYRISYWLDAEWSSFENEG